MVGGATILGSALGILKNILLASRFGASAELDVYFAAFRIPDFLYSVFIFSTLSASFFPVFSRVLAAGKEQAWKLLSALIALFSLFLGIGAIAVFLSSARLAALLAPGFSPPQLDLLSSLLRVLMLQPILMALANLFADALQSFKRFFISTLAPVFYNGGIIVGVLWFSQRVGIYGVVWGVVLGSGLYALIQVPTLRGIGFRFSLSFKEMWNDVKDMLLLMIPRSFTLVANNAVLFWVTMLSSLLPIGSLSVYSLADSFQALPQTVIALSFVTVAFPQLAQQWIKSRSAEEHRETERARFLSLFDAAAGQIMAWLVPSALLFVAFADPIVRIFLGHGNFNVADQRVAIAALMVFALGIPAQGLLMLLIRTFFATEDTKQPLFATLLSLLIVFPAMWLFATRWGVAGLIAGIVLGAWFNCLYLLRLFRRRFPDAELRRFSYGTSRGFAIGVISAVIGAAAYFGTQIVISGSAFGAVFARAAFAGAVSLLTLGVCVFVYKIIDLSKFLERAESSDSRASDFEA